MFIAFEGVDGSGKGTQIELVAKKLRKSGWDVIVEHDPMGTPLADALRKIVLDADIEADVFEEALLFSTARRSLSRKIAKHVAAGKFVICDRWYLSTCVYQGFVGTAPLSTLDMLNGLLACHPSKTFLIDVDASVAVNRLELRGDDLTDRFESRGAEFIEQLVRGYRSLASASERDHNVQIIDGNRRAEDVASEIVQLLDSP